MLEQIFNSPDVAKAGLMVSGPIILAGVTGVVKAVSSFDKHKGFGKAGPIVGGAISLVVAAGGGFVAWEAWPRADGSGDPSANVPIADTYNPSQP